MQKCLFSCSLSIIFFNIHLKSLKKSYNKKINLIYFISKYLEKLDKYLWKLTDKKQQGRELNYLKNELMSGADKVKLKIDGKFKLDLKTRALFKPRYRSFNNTRSRIKEMQKQN